MEDEFHFECLRADESYENPKIDDMIIKHLLEDDLVIADLSGHNANVFYELAVRHSIQKPAILLIQAGQKIPFDITTYRTFFYDFKDVNIFKEAEEELRKQVQAVVDGKFIPDSPIKGSLISLQRVREGSDNWTEIYTILRNHTKILSELNLKVDTFRTRDKFPLTIERVIPLYPPIEMAMNYLTSEGFQFIFRSKDEVPDITGYSDSGHISFSNFVRNTKINLRNGIPWINQDPNGFLWFWIQEYERIFSYAPVTFKHLAERLASKRTDKGEGY